jgi:hypothetical protein
MDDERLEFWSLALLPITFAVMTLAFLAWLVVVTALAVLFVVAMLLNEAWDWWCWIWDRVFGRKTA